LAGFLFERGLCVVTFEQAIDTRIYKHVIKAIRRPSDLKLQFICTFYYDFVIFADTMSSCVRTTNVSVRQHALEWYVMTILHIILLICVTCFWSTARV